MFHNKRYTFKKSPMHYMKDRIEQARLQISVTQEDFDAYNMPNITDTNNDSSASEEADDELSSSASSDRLSPPDSPLLPLFTKSGKMDRTLLLISQPVSVVLLATLVFVCSSTALGVLDRFNMYQATFKFPYPFTVLTMQLIFTAALILLIGLGTRIWNHKVSEMPSLEGLVVPDAVLTTFTINGAILRDHFAISATFVASHAASVACLEYVPMHYFTLFLCPMVPLQLYLTKWYDPKAVQTWAMAMSCIVLLAGYALIALTTGPSVHGMPGFNYRGLISGLIAAIALPFHQSLVTQALARNHKPVQLLWIVVVSSLIMIFPIVIVSGEFFEIAANCYFLDERGYWAMMSILCAVYALSVISTFTLLAYITPLTFLVISFARTALVMAPISARLNRNTFGVLCLIGWGISLAALASYLFLINQHRPRFGLRWN